MEGKLITFEGIDASGKSTQINLLKEKLVKDNISFIIYREPGSNKLSEKIRDILLDKSYDINDISETMLFLGARAQLTNENILKSIKKQIIICDRFTDSTLAYQGYGKGVDKEFITRCNNFITQKLNIYLTIIMDLSYKDSISRMNKDNERKESGQDRMESNTEEFYNKVRNGYISISKSNPDRYLLVDATQSANSIHKLIWNKLRNEINS